MSHSVLDFARHFREVFRTNTPHTGQLRSLVISPDGEWVLSSSDSQGRRLLLLTCALNGRSHGIVDMGHNTVLSIAWKDNDHFFLGCKEGQMYLGRIQGGGVRSLICLRDLWLLTSNFSLL